jgi:UDP-glucose 4-epimerase
LLEWQTELSLEEGIASALAWVEKRHEVLGYE